MIEPVELQDFFITFFSGAMVITCGALYALLFAYARVHNRPRLIPLAYTSYVLLVIFVALLADATHLGGFWHVVVYTMLFGYFLAPHAIWHLCEGTHQPDGRNLPVVGSPSSPVKGGSES